MPILPAEPEMYPDNLLEEDAGRVDAERRWYCLHTRPRQEKALARDLRARRVSFYLPQIVHEDRTPAGRKTRSLLPLFGGYLFLYGDEADRVEALKGNRLVNILDVVDQEGLVRDLKQVNQMLNSGLAIESEPVVPLGGRVRIASGPLAGLVGTVIRRDQRDQFVAIVKILGRGAAVTLQDWQVEVVPE